ncbi:hypothetical protein DPMN_084536 [Dreissena polymorpha]|uniref:Uncharacterized protein n=1 Tax=Dreissena polymorpha TaxID=45954 RepID=A0A9D3YDB0_DREPO|nr:hypothetical protein DPMN_084536 [Dreissena polymorpha]
MFAINSTKSMGDIPAVPEAVRDSRAIGSCCWQRHHLVSILIYDCSTDLTRKR